MYFRGLIVTMQTFIGLKKCKKKNIRMKRAVNKNSSKHEKVYIDEQKA